MMGYLLFISVLLYIIGHYTFYHNFLLGQAFLAASSLTFIYAFGKIGGKWDELFNSNSDPQFRE